MFDFEIRDNLLFTKKSVVAIFQMEPIDIALLDEEGQMSFFAGLSTAFNVLQGDIQFNVVGKKSSIDDFSEYFKSMKMQNLGDQNRLNLVNNVIADMSSLIEDPEEQILTKNFYFHLKEECKTADEKNFVNAIKALSLRVQRITGVFIHAGINIEQVKENNLKQYIQEYY